MLRLAASAVEGDEDDATVRDFADFVDAMTGGTCVYQWLDGDQLTAREFAERTLAFLHEVAQGGP